MKKLFNKYFVYYYYCFIKNVLHFVMIKSEKLFNKYSNKYWNTLENYKKEEIKSYHFYIKNRK